MKHITAAFNKASRRKHKTWLQVADDEFTALCFGATK